MEDKDEEIVGIIMIKTGNSDEYKEAQKLANKHYKTQHGRIKAEIWTCHRLKINEPILPQCKKSRCENCGYSIVYDPALQKNMRKDARKICRDCMLNVDEFSEHLSEEDKKLLSRGMEK